MTEYVLGIDLGTTNSAVSIVQGGEAEVLKNSGGDKITPSVVRFPAEDDNREQPYVGDMALNAAVQFPDHTVQSVKRRMGDGTQVNTADGAYPPRQISSFILRKLKYDAADRLSIDFQDFTEAVITVPAYFTEDQRQATRAAAEMAEFDTIHIINEPSAAAMSYGHRKHDEKESVLVYDLGGGTFDVSVLEVGDGAFRVKATNGIRDLGGDDWDEAVAEWIAEKVRQEHGVNPLTQQPEDDPSDYRERRSRIYEEAKNAKETLCSHDKGEIQINLPHLMIVDNSIVGFTTDLEHSEFKRITADLLEQTIDPTLDTINEAGYNVHEIDEVLLVGGSTRMPQVKEQLEEIFGVSPSRSVDPALAVAKGAAIHGNDERVLLQEVTPLSLGIKVQGGRFKPLIDRNTTLPAEGSNIFTTSTNKQTTVEIEVYQGEREIAEENRYLRTFYLTNIPTAPQGVPQIEVTFHVNREGIVTARAQELSDTEGEYAKEVQIEGVTDISESEVENYIREARRNEVEDQEYTEIVKAENKAKETIDKAESYLKRYPGLLDEAEQQEVRGKITRVEEALETEQATLAQLNSATETLEDHLMKIGERIVDHHSESPDEIGGDLGETPADSGNDGPLTASPNGGNAESGPESGGQAKGQAAASDPTSENTTEDSPFDVTSATAEGEEESGASGGAADETDPSTAEETLDEDEKEDLPAKTGEDDAEGEEMSEEAQAHAQGVSEGIDEPDEEEASPVDSEDLKDEEDEDLDFWEAGTEPEATVGGSEDAEGSEQEESTEGDQPEALDEPESEPSELESADDAQGNDEDTPELPEGDEDPEDDTPELEESAESEESDEQAELESGDEVRALEEGEEDADETPELESGEEPGKVDGTPAIEEGESEADDGSEADSQDTETTEESESSEEDRVVTESPESESEDNQSTEEADRDTTGENETTHRDAEEESSGVESGVEDVDVEVSTGGESDDTEQSGSEEDDSGSEQEIGETEPETSDGERGDIEDADENVSEDEGEDEDGGEGADEAGGQTGEDQDVEPDSKIGTGGESAVDADNSPADAQTSEESSDSSSDEEEEDEDGDDEDADETTESAQTTLDGGIDRETPMFGDNE